MLTEICPRPQAVYAIGYETPRLPAVIAPQAQVVDRGFDDKSFETLAKGVMGGSALATCGLLCATELSVPSVAAAGVLAALIGGTGALVFAHAWNWCVGSRR